MNVNEQLDSLLQSFAHFGVNLGLERINRLLAALNNPQQQVPTIHVAGTNGKGSVCAYLSTILTEAGYRVGRYTSPHLVDWTERICINNQPIAATTLLDLIQQIKDKIDPNLESPTQFEIITAAAWLFFQQQQVDVAVMEVGLGGRLDATNVIKQPLVSVITSISREHWQRLGPTVAHIAGEKAGIIKPGCPVVVGKLPPDAAAVVEHRIKTYSCPAVWVEPARFIASDTAQYGDLQYSLPLPGQVQLINSAIAISTIKILQQQGWQISPEAVVNGIAKTRWRGRLQWATYHNQPLLIDGAHNQAAAEALRQYVDTLDRRIIWVMGMLSTKDHAEIFKALLREGDRLHLVPVPDHSTAVPQELAVLAQKICPNLSQCQTHKELSTALATAYQQRKLELVVLCGSLYLIGYFLRQLGEI